MFMNFFAKNLQKEIRLSLKPFSLCFPPSFCPRRIRGPLPSCAPLRALIFISVSFHLLLHFVFILLHLQQYSQLPSSSHIQNICPLKKSQLLLFFFLTSRSLIHHLLPDICFHHSSKGAPLQISIGISLPNSRASGQYVPTSPTMAQDRGDQPFPLLA